MHKITPSVEYNQWLKRFDTKPIKQPITFNKIPKIVKLTNEYYMITIPERDVLVVLAVTD